MRIYTDSSEQYVYALAMSLMKDPASLDSWRCLHIHPLQPEIADITAITAVRDAHKEMDCDIVICPDGDILLISREMDKAALESLAGALTINMLDQAPELHAYDLFCDWRRIRVLLLSKTHAAHQPAPAPLESENFGEIQSFTDVFSAAKKKRRARHPQYIMLVEDDPLTRRIVSGALKEQYALVTAADAHEAISVYLLHAPDIVFLDIGLPDVSGFAVLRQIIASDPDAYVVMFSSNSYLDNVTKALNNGAAGFIAKPFRKEKLHKYIEDSVLHHRKSQSLQG